MQGLFRDVLVDYAFCAQSPGADSRASALVLPRVPARPAARTAARPRDLVLSDKLKLSREPVLCYKLKLSLNRFVSLKNVWLVLQSLVPPSPSIL